MTVDPLGIDWRTVEGRMAARQRLIVAERENEALRWALEEILTRDPYADMAGVIAWQIAGKALSSD